MKLFESAGYVPEKICTAINKHTQTVGAQLADFCTWIFKEPAVGIFKWKLGSDL